MADLADGSMEFVPLATDPDNTLLLTCIGNAALHIFAHNL